MDHNVQVVHRQLDAFQVQVFEHPSPINDMDAFQTELANLRADVDAILAILVVVPQVAPSAFGDDTIMRELFSDDDVGKRPEAKYKQN